MILPKVLTNTKKAVENEVLENVEKLQECDVNKIIKSLLGNSSAINILPLEKFSDNSKLESAEKKQNSSNKLCNIICEYELFSNLYITKFYVQFSLHYMF